METSALAKLYVRETGTEEMLRLANSVARNELAVLTLARIEMRSAIRRRERAGDILPAAATKMIERLTTDLESLYLIQPLTEAVITEAAGIVDRHLLKAYDAIQLAGCITLRDSSATATVFVCADQQLIKAAEKERLTVLNPETVRQP